MLKKIKKLRYKLIIAVLVLMSLVLMVVAGVTHHQSVAAIRVQSYELNRHLVEAGVEKLETSCVQLNSLFQSVYLNDDFKSLLRRQGGVTDNAGSFADAFLAKSVFLSVLSSRQDLYSIIYIDLRGRLFYATRDKAGFYENYMDCCLPESYLNEIRDIHTWKNGMRMMPTERHPQFGNVTREEPYVYAAARKIVNTENQFATAGVMFITADLSDMERLTDLICPNNESVTYISNSEGHVIFDSTFKRIGGNLSNSVMDQLDETTLRDVKFEDGQTYIMVSAQSRETGWHVITLIPEAVYTSDALSVSKAILLTACIALIVAAIFTYMASSVISRPIEKLAKVMTNAGLDNLHERVEIRGRDEIAQLGATFNHLMDDLECSIHNEYIMNIQQKETKIQALQAQMNPHFLYNVLQSMASMALIHNVPEIATMATALGNVLRYNIRADDAFATVREELEHVENYLSIQKIRFRDRLNYFIDAPECTMDGLLPRVSIQLMVENAIIHGFEARQEPGTILIRVWLEGEDLVIEVADDGQGITSDNLKLLKKELDAQNGSDAHSMIGIGLSNLNARIKLLYEKAGILQIDSEYSVGTVVRIEVPMKRRGEKCTGS